MRFSCVLSAVDKRPYQRMRSTVLAHDPNQDDLPVLWRRGTPALDDRDRARQGITTAGSALSPAPSRLVFGDGRPQRCTFHVIQDLPQGGWQAVATERDRWAQSTPQGGRGRPSSTDQQARRLARQSPAMPQQSRAVCHDRVVCVQRRLTPWERQRLWPITRGLPQLRTLRESMEHLAAFCDRRCHTQTALGKLRKLRQGVQRFTWLGKTVKKGGSPTRAHALTLLDDT